MRKEKTFGIFICAAALYMLIPPVHYINESMHAVPHVILRILAIHFFTFRRAYVTSAMSHVADDSLCIVIWTRLIFHAVHDEKLLVSLFTVVA